MMFRTSEFQRGAKCSVKKYFPYHFYKSIEYKLYSSFIRSERGRDRREKREMGEGGEERRRKGEGKGKKGEGNSVF